MNEALNAIVPCRAASRVVCAANLVNGHLICGARHGDAVMLAQAALLGKAYSFMQESMVEGFIDQHGQFLTREEAWAVALAAGQIYRRVGGDEGCLYSENLY